MLGALFDGKLKDKLARRARVDPPEPRLDSPLVAKIAASFESAGHLEPFTLNGADVANSSTLEAVVRQVAFRNELILLCGDGKSGGSPNALNTALQFYALRLRHVLFVSDSAHSCERLRAGLPELACVWSSRVSRSKPRVDGECVKRFWDMRFYFYDVRKHLVAQLAGELGVNVLQTDTDVAWFGNPCAWPRPLLGACADGRFSRTSTRASFASLSSLSQTACSRAARTRRRTCSRSGTRPL
jgi:hypothetical protein